MLAPKIKLNNGEEMPCLGLGTYKSTKNDCETSVKYAIDCGYRHIDTAYVYENEKEVGKAINDKISEGAVKRDELFIVTKLAGIHHAPEHVEHACRISLANLGLQYIDLFLIHFPVGSAYINDYNLSPLDSSGRLKFSDIDYVDTWKAMENLVKMKLVRSIGLSNFNSEQTERVLQNCEIKPVTNQVECHPGFNQKKLIDFSKQRGIVITAYCPLGRPDTVRRRPNYLFDEKINSLAEKYNKTPAQIVLRYLVEIGAVPIPKSVNKDRIEQNFQIFNFTLNEEDIKFMDTYDTGRRMIPFDVMRHHKYFPFNIEF